jgi:hypothetical protein
MRFSQYLNSPDVFWHGSPSGDLRGGPQGLHIGTKIAAKQALEARIGIPAKGEWDGTREYGKTLLMGKKNMQKYRRMDITGFNCDAPDEDYYPKDSRGKATYADGTAIPMTVNPDIFPVRIKGHMTNTAVRPHTDFRANSLMQRQLKLGRAKSGYFYSEEGEDTGSVAAALPDGTFIERLK